MQYEAEALLQSWLLMAPWELKGVEFDDGEIDDGRRNSLNSFHNNMCIPKEVMGDESMCSSE